MFSNEILFIKDLQPKTGSIVECSGISKNEIEELIAMNDEMESFTFPHNLLPENSQNAFNDFLLKVEVLVPKSRYNIVDSRSTASILSLNNNNPDPMIYKWHSDVVLNGVSDAIIRLICIAWAENPQAGTMTCQNRLYTEKPILTNLVMEYGSAMSSYYDQDGNFDQKYLNRMDEISESLNQIIQPSDYLVSTPNEITRLTFTNIYRNPPILGTIHRGQVRGKHMVFTKDLVIRL